MMQALCPGTKVIVKEFEHGAGVVTDTILRMVDDELCVRYLIDLDNGGNGEFEEVELEPQPGMVLLVVEFQ
jgi:hypothetical protein